MTKLFNKGKGVYIEFNSPIILVTTKPAEMFTLFSLVFKTQLAHSLQKAACDGRNLF